MKRLRYGVYTIGALASVLFCFFIEQKVAERVHTVQQVHYDLDDQFSQAVRKALSDYVTAQIQERHVREDELFKNVSSQFPCVASLATHYCPPGIMTCTIKARIPSAVINDVHVVCADAHIVPIASFIPTACQNLPTLSASLEVAHAEMAPEALVHSLAHITPELQLQYGIEWCNEFEILLRDKALQQYKVMCSATTLPDHATLSYCEQIKQRLCNDGAFKARIPTQWTVDVRFARQIVVSCEKKGVTNGSRV